MCKQLVFFIMAPCTWLLCIMVRHNLSCKGLCRGVSIEIRNIRAQRNCLCLQLEMSYLCGNVSVGPGRHHKCSGPKCHCTEVKHAALHTSQEIPCCLATAAGTLALYNMYLYILYLFPSNYCSHLI